MMSHFFIALMFCSIFQIFLQFLGRPTCPVCVRSLLTHLTISGLQTAPPSQVTALFQDCGRPELLVPGRKAEALALVSKFLVFDYVVTETWTPKQGSTHPSRASTAAHPPSHSRPHSPSSGSGSIPEGEEGKHGHSHDSQHHHHKHGHGSPRGGELKHAQASDSHSASSAPVGEDEIKRANAAAREAYRATYANATRVRRSVFKDLTPWDMIVPGYEAAYDPDATMVKLLFRVYVQIRGTGEEIYDRKIMG